MIKQKQLLFVELIVNGEYKRYTISVPFNMTLKEAGEQIISHYKDIKKIEEPNLSREYYKKIKINRISRNTPIYSLEE